MSTYPLSLFGGAHGQLGLLGSMMLGLSMGLTACTVTCLPFMGTWVLGRGKGHDLAMRDTWLFLAGRVLAYSVLGLFAGSLGATLTAWLASGVGNLAIGLASCCAGCWLLQPVPGALRRLEAGLRTRPAEGSRPLVFVRDRHLSAADRAQGTARRSCSRLGRGAGLPPMLLGLSLSLSPCAPLGWLLTVCSLSGSAAAGLGHGLAFGLGAAVTPLLLLVPLFGVLGGRLLDGRAWLAHWLAGGAGVVLIVLGVKRLYLLV